MASGDAPGPTMDRVASGDVPQPGNRDARGRAVCARSPGEAGERGVSPPLPGGRPGGRPPRAAEPGVNRGLGPPGDTAFFLPSMSSQFSAGVRAITLVKLTFSEAT